MVTTKTIPANRQAMLDHSYASSLFNDMLSVIINIQTSTPEVLFIYKEMVKDLKFAIDNSAEIKFLDSALGLVSDATKDALVDMETLLDLDDDDATELETKDFHQVTTKDLELPPSNKIEKPKSGGMTVTPTATSLWLTKDVIGDIDDKQMACITTTEGASPLLEIDIWGFSKSPWPEAYQNMYKIVRPISAAAMKLWKGETEICTGQRCAVIKCAFADRNAEQKRLADKDLLGNKS